MTTEHTPTPWKYHCGAIEAKDGTRLALLVSGGKISQEDNATFIVRAVNSHDALVAALEDIRSLAHRPYSGDGIAAICMAALHLARGED